MHWAHLPNYVLETTFLALPRLAYNSVVQQWVKHSDYIRSRNKCIVMSEFQGDLQNNYNICQVGTQDFF